MTKKKLVREELHTLQIERFRFQHLKTRLDKVRGHIVHGSDNSFGFDIQCDIQVLTLKKHACAFLHVFYRNCTICAKRSREFFSDQMLLMMPGLDLRSLLNVVICANKWPSRLLLNMCV